MTNRKELNLNTVGMVNGGSVHSILVKKWLQRKKRLEENSSNSDNA